MTHDPPEIVSDIQHYYDKNTMRFLKYGNGISALAIHQPLYAPGVYTKMEAADYINDLIYQQIISNCKQNSIQYIIDLGCGVGGSLLSLSKKLKFIGVGLTISVNQALFAQNNYKNSDNKNKIYFIVANYLQIPLLAKYNIAYAIESFVHNTNPDGFFSELSSYLNDNGLLIICDDFLSDSKSILSKNDHFWINKFKNGWHISALMRINEIRSIAEKNKFEIINEKDLTPYLKYGIYIPRFIFKLLGHISIHTPFWNNISGGSARQICIKKSLIKYKMLTFRKK